MSLNDKDSDDDSFVSAEGSGDTGLNLGGLSLHETNELHHSKSGIEEDLLNHGEGDNDNDCNREDCQVRIEKDLFKAIELKELGNAAFREKRFEESIDIYSNAIDVCPDEVVADGEEDVLAVLLGNRSAAHFSLGEMDSCVFDCSACVERNYASNLAKVLFRRSNALEKLEKYEEALQG